jgi:hypothetical protein
VAVQYPTRDENPTMIPTEILAGTSTGISSRRQLRHAVIIWKLRISGETPYANPNMGREQDPGSQSRGRGASKMSRNSDRILT